MFINSPYKLFLKEDKFNPCTHFGDFNNPSQRYFILQEVETLFVRFLAGAKILKGNRPSQLFTGQEVRAGTAPPTDNSSLASCQLPTQLLADGSQARAATLRAVRAESRLPG